MQIQGLGEKRMDPYMNILYGDQILCAMLRDMNITISFVSTMNQLDIFNMKKEELKLKLNKVFFHS